MEPYISVVVPVYNASKYLHQCVDSLINQTLKNIELIFVDDGSTDNSLNILKEYAARDSRIMILEQKNQYAGVARNNGMKHASGKYIIFLDSDDFFELNMLEELYTAAENNQTDIVIFGFYGYDDVTGSTELTPIPEAPSEVFTPEELGADLFAVCDVIPWNKLFLREFVLDENITFQSLKNSNDAFFSRISVSVAKRLFYQKKRYVHYRYNNQNSLQGSRESAILCFGEAYCKIKEELINRGIYEGNIKDSYVNAILEFIDVRFDYVEQKKNIELIYEYLKTSLLGVFFDDIDEIPKEHIAFRICNSECFVDFLEGEYLFQREKIQNMVSRYSIEYRVGRKITAFVRKIKRIIRLS